MLMIIFIMMISWMLIRFGNLGKLGVTELGKHCLQGRLERVHFLQVMIRIIWWWLYDDDDDHYGHDCDDDDNFDDDNKDQNDDHFDD